MYCLISKPVLKYTNDKVTIQLFYYLNIPKKKVFRFFSISYINSIKKKWLAHNARAEKKKPNFEGLTYSLPLAGASNHIPKGRAITPGQSILPSLPRLPQARQGRGLPAAQAAQSKKAKC